MEDERCHSIRKPSLSEWIGQVELLRGQAQAIAAAGEATPLELLRWAIDAERASINTENSKKSAGRPPADWEQRLGMDPVDALVLKELLYRLGVKIKPALLIRLIAAHAVGVAGSLIQEPRRVVVKRRQLLQKQLKSFFFDRPPPSYQAACDARISKLADQDVLQEELRITARRIDPNWTDATI